MIRGRKPNSNITFMNSFYRYPRKNEDTGKYDDDTMTIIYKDLDTGKKHHETIHKPDYEYYKVKPEYVKDYNELFIEADKCDKIVVPFNTLEKSIAEETGNTEFYKKNIANRNRGENRKLHTIPSVMFSDTNIDDHYRFRFGNLYKNDIPRLDKGYFDIEVDGKYQAGDFPELGECPINCCSYLDEKTKCVYTFILRDERNPLVQQFEDSLNDELLGELKQFVINSVGGLKQSIRFGVNDINYKILFFDDEIGMIYYMFQLFHKIDPDFILAWNMAFDIPYVIARIRNLGYEPEEIMTNPDFEVKIADYWVDTRNQNEFAERSDFATISGNIVFIDQMIQFASRRKAKVATFPDFKLDTIGEISAKVKKLDYSHITLSVVELPYLDFKTFVFYNVMDVVVQKCIETKTQDIEYIFTKCLVNNTSYKKGHRQTVYLANRFAKDFYNDGLIIGNNTNRWNEKPDKYAGALVGRPENLNDYSKLVINGRPIMVANNLVDEDYKSLYPSIDIENNIAPNTLFGSIVIPEQVYDKENYYNNDKYNRAGEFTENMVTDNVLEFSHRYFKLAGYEDMLHDIAEYFESLGFETQLSREYSSGLYFGSDTTQAVNFNYKHNAVNFFPESLDNYDKYKEQIRKVVG